MKAATAQANKKIWATILIGMVILAPVNCNAGWEFKGLIQGEPYGECTETGTGQFLGITGHFECLKENDRIWEQQRNSQSAKSVTPPSTAPIVENAQRIRVVPTNIPKNGELDKYADQGWSCKVGYMQTNQTCILKVQPRPSR
jgi:hypothetical protein